MPPFRAEPGRVPWAKTRPPGARLRAPTPGLAPGWGPVLLNPGVQHQKMSVCVEEEEDRSESAGSSCLSLESDGSKAFLPPFFSNEPGPSDSKVQSNKQRSESAGSSCLSLKSDGSLLLPLNFSNEPGPSDSKIQSLPAVDTGSADSASAHTGTSLLHQETPPVPSVEKDPELELDCRQPVRPAVYKEVMKAGSETLLNRIYTELYITEGQSEEVNTQHEVRQLETASKMKTLHDTPIKCHDIFKALPDQQKHIRVVLMNGVAGVGKTFSVQKFTLDWAEGLENQDKYEASLTPRREEYFRRRVSDEDLSSRIISHIKTSRTLHIMCQIPVFCWITATVLDHMLTTDQRGELPKTLTDLYSHFLLVQTKRKKQKYDEGHETSPQELMEADRKLLLKLGRLAFEHLEKGNIMFYQEDLEQCGSGCHRGPGVLRSLYRDLQKRVCDLPENSLLLCSSEHSGVSGCSLHVPLLHQQEHKGTGGLPGEDIFGWYPEESHGEIP
ncbi:hypothetical protein L3Q82_004764 [Scortum barcoo]|uniref:Uncharacterized protein n=1 Tax=Scortum barcoo TaxID=214431 RepID=A0ACB8VI87_9TELE|nr:hypothetical protein L3Q82_004764 [Scortum barcoo]